MFGRATITLGIGPHPSFTIITSQQGSERATKSTILVAAREAAAVLVSSGIFMGQKMSLWNSRLPCVKYKAI